MLPTARGLQPIDELCARHRASLAFRLRGEYLPGPAPFPESPEEAEYLKKRETLVLTVLAAGGRFIVQCAWMVGGQERLHQSEIDRAAMGNWTERIAACGGWRLDALATLPAGEGTIELEHEAYEYQESDPESLDLASWKPPRHWRVARGANGASAGITRGLVSLYHRFLPADGAGSPLLSRLRLTTREPAG